MKGHTWKRIFLWAVCVAQKNHSTIVKYENPIARMTDMESCMHITQNQKKKPKERKIANSAVAQCWMGISLGALQERAGRSGGVDLVQLELGPQQIETP